MYILYIFVCLCVKNVCTLSMCHYVMDLLYTHYAKELTIGESLHA